MKKVMSILALLNVVLVGQSFASISSEMLESDPSPAQIQAAQAAEAKREFIRSMKNAETSVDTYRQYRDAAVSGQEMPAWLPSALKSIVNSKTSGPFAKNYAQDIANVLNNVHCGVTLASADVDSRRGKSSAHFMEPATPRKGATSHTGNYMGPSRSEQSQGAPYFDSGSGLF